MWNRVISKENHLKKHAWESNGISDYNRESENSL